MATYVNDLRLTELATGEGSGTWGTTTNQSLELIGEALGYATQQAFGSDADATTTVADGASDPARAMYYKITSAASLTATRTLTIAPNTISRVMFIENATSGSQSIAISQGSGANVTIATGKTAVVYLDGAGAGAAVVDAMAGVDPGVTDTLAEVLTAGNTTTTDQKIQFRDTGIYINSSADGQLDIVADTEIQIAATTIDVNGTLAFDSLKGTGATTVTNILDEDNMASDSATAIATQQSIKAYVDSQVGSFDTLAEVLAQGNTTGGTDLAVSTGDDITFADSSKAIFGAGSDLQIYHDGSHSYIKDAGTGQLRLLAGTNVQIWNSDATSLAANFNGDTQTSLYYAGAAKLATTATGIDVTGTVTADGLDVEIADNLASPVSIQQGGNAYFKIVTTNSSESVQLGNSTTNPNILMGGGNVGIGDTNPANGYLTIRGATTTGTKNGHIMLTGDSATNGQGPQIVFSESGISSNFAGASVGYVRTGSNGIGDLVFGTRAISGDADTVPTERMRIDSLGGITAASQAGGHVVFNSNTVDADFRVAYNSGTHALYVDGATGNVGIGTSSPSSLYAGATNLVVGGGTAESGMTIYSDSTTGNLYFADGTTGTEPYAGYIEYNHASDFLRVGTAGTERMRIDASGTLLVGTTDSTPYNNSGTGNGGAGIQGDGLISAAREDLPPAIFNRLVSDGSIVEFRKDGSGPVGIIATVNGDLLVGTGDTGLRFHDTDNRIYPINTSGGAKVDATIDLGDPTGRFKDLHLSGGVYTGGDKFVYSYAGGAFGQVRSGFKLDGTNNRLEFYTSQGERMRIDASGNVGIGQSNPTSPNDATDFLHIGSATNQDTSIVLQDAVETWEIYQNDNLSFLFDTTNVMTLQRLTGNVGIGQNTPKTTLNLAANNSGQGAILTLENTDTSITSNDVIGQIDFYANDGSTNGTGAKVNIKAIAASGAGTVTALTFGTSDSTSATAVEAMRIDASGRVGIGCTPSYTLEVRTNDTSVTPQQVIRQLGIGDAAIGFQIPSAANWYAGVDNSASDSFVIGRGLAVGTNVAMTLDASGNLLVGTTDSSGDTANSKPVVAGRFTTKNGVTSGGTSGSTVTLMTFGSNEGNFLVSARASGTGAITDNTTGIIHINNSASSYTALAAGSKVVLSMSGLALQVTQTVFTGANISWNVVRIS